MKHYVENPSQTRIRQLEPAALHTEVILNVSVTVEHGTSEMTGRALSVIAAKLLNTYLNDLNEVIL